MFWQKHPRLTAVSQALLVTFLWSTSWVFIKIGLEDIPPLTFAGLRYGLAFLCLLPLFWMRQGPAQLKALPRRTWLRLLTLGILFYALTQGAQFVGLAYLPAVTVNLMLGFTSVIVALLGIVFLSERPSLRQWAGIALSLIGVVIYFAPIAIPAAQLIGFTAVIIGVLANASSSILGRVVNQDQQLTPLTVTVVSMGTGALILLVSGLILQGMPSLSWQSWAIILWLAVVNTAFAFTLWNRTLQTLTAFESSIINNTMAVQIPILAVLFLGETITQKELFGLVVTIIGVFLVQLGRANLRSLRLKRANSKT